MQETELYAPVRGYFADLGFDVKAEVASCDVVAVGPDGALVIVELKTSFALTLFHQAISRLALTDQVYVAVPRGKGRPWIKSLRRNMVLCRRLGVGLLVVDVAKGGVDPKLAPGPYKPRSSKAKRASLMREFERREGDPNVGGSTRTTLVTSYRQDAERCAQFLALNGPHSAKAVAAETQVTRARQIMYDNHYGWFERPERAVYGLTEKGRAATA